jgi:hypothetical protein
MDFFEIEGGASMPDGSVSLNIRYRTGGKIRLTQNRWINQPEGWRKKSERPIGWKNKWQIMARVDTATNVIEGTVESENCGDAQFTKQGAVAGEIIAATNEKKPVYDEPLTTYTQVTPEVYPTVIPKGKNSNNKTENRNHTRQKSAPLAATQAIPGLDGRFEGAYFCKSAIGRAVVVMKTVGDDYNVTQTIDSVTKSLKTKIRSARDDGFLSFELQERRWLDEKAISQIRGADVLRVDDEVVYLSAGMLSTDCRGMLLYRFKHINGLKGKYMAAPGLHSACDTMEQHWLPNITSERTAAGAIKTALPRLFASYNTNTASNAGILSGERFKSTFGVHPDDLSAEQQMELRTQLRMCALLTDELQRNVFQTAFFVPGSLARSIRVSSISASWNPELDVPLLTPLSQLAKRSRASEKALSMIKKLVAELLLMSDPELIRETIKKRNIVNHDVLPSELKAALDPLIDHLNTLERQHLILLRAQIGDLDVPYEVIPTAAHSLFRQLENQNEVSLDGASMQYLGGMASYLAKACELPEDKQQRERSLDFATTTALRAGLGINLDEPKLKTAVTDLLSSGLSFESGYETASSLGCAERFNQQIAQLIGSGIATNRNGPSGLSLFVRSCAVEFDIERCDCIQSQLQAAYPNIATQQYQRRFIASAIKQRPLIAANMVFRCKVSDY